MLPVIQPGAALSIEPGSFTEQNPTAGEIIAFRRGAGPVCHRFYGTVRIGRRRYGIERGDRNRIAGLFRLDDYIGRLITVGKTDGRELFKEVQKPAVFTLFGGLLYERFDWIRRKLMK